MGIALRFTAAVLVSLAAPGAYAQLCDNSTQAEPYVRLVDIPGITGITPLTFSDRDDGQATVNLPFTFSFLGTSFTNVNLGSNGYLTFGAENASIPSNEGPGFSIAPNAWIAMLWDDLVHPTAANARWGVLGSAPNRIIIIEGGPATRYPGAGGTLFYQAWLYEGTERFEWKATGDPVNALSYTTGYEGPGGHPFWDGQGCGSNCSLTQLQDGLQFRHIPGNDLNVYGTANLDVLGGALPGQSFPVQVLLVMDPPGAPSMDVGGGLFLSADDTWDPTDVLMVSHTETAMTGGVSRTAALQATVPAGTPPGFFYVFWVADPANNIVECVELDNAFTVGTFATARDERGVNAVPRSSVTRGAAVDVELILANEGVLMARTLEVQLWASADDILDATDVRLVSQTVVLQYAAFLEFVTVRPTIGLNLAPGMYRIFLVVDPQNLVTEADETDNTTMGEFLVVDPDTCGDGLRTGLEGCDDGNATTEACVYGAVSCLVCDAGCAMGPGVPIYCGDGIEQMQEQCDDGNNATESCAYGAPACVVCAAGCQFGLGIPRVCGDGNVTDTETCDDGNAVTERCAYGVPSCMVCDAACTLVAGQTSLCGDGTRSMEEACDDGNTVTEACAYGLSSCVVCDAACAVVPGLATYCGDGTLTAPEGCDDGNSMSGDGCSATCAVEMDGASSTGGSSGVAASSGGGGSSSAVASSGAGSSTGGDSGVVTSGLASSGVSSTGGASSAVASSGVGGSSSRGMSGGASSGGVSTGSSTMVASSQGGVSSIGGGGDEEPDNRRCTCAQLRQTSAPWGLVVMVLAVLVRRRRR